MMNLKKSLLLKSSVTALVALLCLPLSSEAKTHHFPAVKQKGKTAVVCHRGYWKSEAGGMSENSIASLKAAQDAGFWGSECDIHITADSVVIVNHDRHVNGMKFNEHVFADYSNCMLPNGERRPTFDEYLSQTALCKSTVLIIELKKQSTEAFEDLLLNKTIEALKLHKLYNPKRVLFITFSRHMCERIAAEHPHFINQFLTSDNRPENAPEFIAAAGINGIDYDQPLFLKHPDWVKQAHKLKMSVNVWTANKAEYIKRFIDMDVDAITTNEPALVRELLGDKEFRGRK